MVRLGEEGAGDVRRFHVSAQAVPETRLVIEEVPELVRDGAVAGEAGQVDHPLQGLVVRADAALAPGAEGQGQVAAPGEAPELKTEDLFEVLEGAGDERDVTLPLVPGHPVAEFEAGEPEAVEEVFRSGNVDRRPFAPDLVEWALPAGRERLSLAGCAARPLHGRRFVNASLVPCGLRCRIPRLLEVQFFRTQCGQVLRRSADLPSALA